VFSQQRMNVIELYSTAADLGAGTFQTVVRLGLKNERSKREDQRAAGAEGSGSGEGVSPSPAD